MLPVCKLPVNNTFRDVCDAKSLEHMLFAGVSKNNEFYTAFAQDKLGLRTMIHDNGAYSWGRVMAVICREGNVEHFKLLISSGLPRYTNEGINAAAMAGRQDMVKLCVEHGPCDYNIGLEAAAFAGHLELVRYFIKLGASKLNSALEAACEANRRVVVEYLIQVGARNFKQAAHTAAMNNHKELTRFIFETERIYREIQLEKAAAAAAASTSGVTGAASKK